MALNCPLCDRVNPNEALFCFHDGAALGGARGGGPIAVGVQPFPSPFVFPSGRFCRTFDELVLACETHWDEARDLLREGLLEGFLSGLGRADLSWAARRGAQASDLDLGLDELLAQLPGAVRKAARLAVQPAEINCGRLPRGADQRFVIRLLNEGMGLLRGAVACSGSEWLVLGDDGAAPDKVFQFRHDQTVPVRVVGKRLRAGFRPPEGRLLIESNGGSTVVLVRVEPPAVVPFAHGVLAGADSPRRLADKTRAAPREAAVYFENGAVAAWYAANGWTYPVQGPPASGIAALQQFYEAVGLAAPPRVELERPVIRLTGAPGAALETAVVVQTSERRAVFAHATTAEPWLAIDRAVLGGRTARIPVRVPSVPDRPGEVLRGRVQVTANGNQRFAVEVALAVAAVAAPAAANGWAVSSAGRTAPAARGRRDAEDGPDALPARRTRRGPGVLAWVVVAAFFLLALGTAAVVVTVVVVTPAGAGQAPSTAQTPTDAPKTGDDPHKQDGNNPNEPPPAEPADVARSLQSEDAAERLAALKKLAALGPKAAPALHAVLRAMKDGDADFRREALVALPRIGPPTAADVDVLMELAGDANFPAGRRYALAALAVLGAAARPAAPALCDALNDADPAVKRKAAEVLGGLGPPIHDAARRPLMKALDDADPDVSAAAAAALNRLGPPTKEDLSDLRTLTAAKTAAARRYALDCLRAIGPEASEFAPFLRDAAAGDASPELRLLALTALQAVAPDARRSIDAYARAVSDDDADVRQAGVAALVKVGPAHGALPGLIRALRSDDTATTKTAADALAAAHLEPKQVEELGDVLREGDGALRLRVMAVLKPLGADAAPAVPALCDVLRDGPAEARRQACALLAAMGPAARRAADDLNKLLDDDKLAVRLDAATALAAVDRSDVGDAISVLVDALRVEQPGDAEQAAQRDRAVEALGRIGEAAVTPLADAVEDDFTGGGLGTTRGKINTEARLAAVKALGAIGAPANTTRVMALLSKLSRIDPSDDVKSAAKEARARIRRSANG